MREEYTRWYTGYLSTNMEMLSFGHAGIPIILFPTSMGKYYQNKDFKLIESIRWYIEKGLVKVYCPDSIDSRSWYNKRIHPLDRVRTHLAYERMIMNEVVYRARVETSQPKVIFAGCSFGGYHAANFAFKFPYDTSYLFSMSGAFDIRMFLDGFYNETCYFNNPVDFIGGLQAGSMWHGIKHMGIALGCAEYDSCKGDNYNLSNILNMKGIPHWLDVRAGSHDWPVWREMFPHYLSMVQY
ncbi:MAG: esterase family protein [Flammeovirgaceae bacterium]